MITVEDLSFDNLIEIPVEDIKYVRGSAYTNGSGRLISDSGEYRLYYANSVNAELENGTDIMNSSGFLITRIAYNQKGNLRDAVQPIAFWPVVGKVSNTSTPVKEEVVEAYNSSLGGQEAATEEVVDNRWRNEDGETNQEVALREREEAEAEAAAEEERTGGAVNYSEPISEDITIREYNELMEFLGGGEWVVLAIIEKRRGTTLSPVVTYQVERYIHQSNPQVMWSETFQTQEEAEAYFDDFISDKTAENIEKTAVETQRRIDTATKRVPYEKADFFYQESTYTFEEMVTMSEGIDWDNMPITMRTLAAGPYNDAISWSNGGDTLNLDDFDAPRITELGIQENPSGAVAFTVIRGWRLKLALETDSSLSFINNAKPDNVAQSGNVFDFTMYSGDRLEIDIDNEREAVSPFFVSVKGKEWFSAEEIDDEVSLTLVNAERLMVHYTSGWKSVMVKDGSDYVGTQVFNQPSVDVEYTAPAWYLGDAPPLSEQQHLAAMSENEIYTQMGVTERIREAPEVAAEDGFISPEDTTEAIGDAGDAVVDAAKDAVDAAGDAVSDAATAVWDSVKWWLLGGLIAIVAVGILVVYVNGRSRRPQVVQTTPVSEA